MNANPIRPELMNEIMFDVFGVGEKKVEIPRHKQIEKEISLMLGGRE